MKDLEIRGAGNLLGPEQSGHIAAVGFDLYCQLLAEAVEELKAKQSGVGKAAAGVSLAPWPTIDLPLSAYLPEDYVADLTTRLKLYQRLAKVSSVDELRQIREEFRDRFGDLPSVVENLLYMVSLRTLAAQARMQSISKEDSQIVIRFREGVKIDRRRLEKTWPGLKVGVTQLRLDMRLLGHKWQGVLEEVVRGWAKD
jgi:transcription-repair coupling factor (superfamily II helicase)